MFKAKLRKIGNSVGVIIPRDVITGLNIGEDIELDVITEVITESETTPLKKKFNTAWCEKHSCMKGSCSCK